MTAALGEPDQRERALGLLFHDLTGVPGDEQREADVLGDGLRRKEFEVLENDADHPAKVRDPRTAQLRDVLIVDDDPAGRRELLADEQADERRLAGAGRADEEREVALIDAEVDVLQRHRPVGVALADVLQADQIPVSLFLNRVAQGGRAAPVMDRNGASPGGATGFGSDFVLSPPLLRRNVRLADRPAGRYVVGGPPPVGD